MEGTIVLREILTRYTLTPSGGNGSARGRVRNITNVPRRGARIAVTPLCIGSSDKGVNMIGTQDRTQRWHRYWDKKSRSYDREMRFMERALFGDSRNWACSQAKGDVLEVAVGTGLNLPVYPAPRTADRS